MVPLPATGPLHDVRAYGARGVARPASELILTRFAYKCLLHPPGTRAVIRDAAPGEEHDSVAIQRAIDAAHAAGGGTVLVPAGDYLIGPLVLRSRVRLHLDAGARLWASPHLADHVNRAGLAAGAPTFVGAGPEVAMHASPLSPWPGHAPGPGAPLNLISAVDAEDVALTGMGEIHGQSPAWLIPWLNAGPTGWATLAGCRPGSACLRFAGCRRVLVEGVRVLDSPSWTLVFVRCDGLRVRGVTIRNFDAINADGIDLVDSANAIITGCDLHVTDDGICLKSDPTVADAPGVRNVVVGDCIIRTWCNGVKIGTEGAGVFADISVANLVIHTPEDDLKWAEGGINLCACDGSTVRNVHISGIVMRRVECPFYLVGMRRERYQQAYRVPRAGTMAGISLSGLRVDGFRYTPFIVGHPERPLADISLRDIALRKDGTFHDALGRPAGSLPVLPPVPPPVPPIADQYPTGFMFGSPAGGTREVGDGLPAQGLYLRDATDVTVRGLRLSSPRADVRPLVVEEACAAVDVADCSFGARS